MKKYITMFLFSLIFIAGISGTVLLRISLLHSMENTLTEHDEHLFDLAYSIDHNLKNHLDRIQEELFYTSQRKDTIQAEQQLLSGSAESLNEILQNSMLTRFDTVEDVLVYSGDELLLCPEHTDGRKYHFLMDDDGDNIMVCYDENEEYYLAIQILAPDRQVSYYALLNMDNFYNDIIAVSLRNDNRICLYDEESGLLLQSRTDQPFYCVLTPEEIRERNDGCAIIMDYQRKQEIGSVTYNHGDGNGTETPSRMVVLPSSRTANGSFTIGVAMDSTEVYKHLQATRNMMTLSLLPILVAMLLVIVLIMYLWNDRRMILYEMEKCQREDALREQLIDAKVKNSISQMQPHFLYNSLSSIREVVLIDPEYASNLIYDFTTHLRACIRAMSRDELVPFHKELDNIRAYVSIEKMRLGDRLQMEYDIEEADFPILPLSIQPLVENSIRHGIFECGDEGGTIRISTALEETEYVVRVSDDGAGFDYEKIQAEIRQGKRDSTALDNLIFRLEKVLHAKVIIESRIGSGTDITVRIPVAEEME